MITRLLQFCGVSLGPAADLLPPAPDNPAGFWENRRFLAVNDMLVMALGGSWSAPPHFTTGWEHHTALDPLVAHARALVETFASASDLPFAWKDPVNTLTLPFWRVVVPDLTVLVCVRHPLDVAASLATRHGWTVASGLELWRRYAERLLADGGPTRRITTHYDAYFDDGPGELRRVTRALGLEVGTETIVRALASRQIGLRNHRSAVRATTLPPGVAIPYAVLCSEAGVDPGGSGRVQPVA